VWLLWLLLLRRRVLWVSALDVRVLLVLSVLPLRGRVAVVQLLRSRQVRLLLWLLQGILRVASSARMQRRHAAMLLLLRLLTLRLVRIELVLSMLLLRLMRCVRHALVSMWLLWWWCVDCLQLLIVLHHLLLLGLCTPLRVLLQLAQSGHMRQELHSM